MQTVGQVSNAEIPLPELLYSQPVSYLLLFAGFFGSAFLSQSLTTIGQGWPCSGTGKGRDAKP